MEGQIAPGQEQFANFLITQTQNFSDISEKHKQILKLYIQLQYGDVMVPRIIPFDFAKTHNLFPDTIRTIEQEIAEKERKEKEVFFQKHQQEFENELKAAEKALVNYKQQMAKEMYKRFTTWPLRTEDFFEDPTKIFLIYVPFYLHKSIQELLAPYLSDEFTSPWREKFYQQNPVQWLSDQIRRFREVAQRAEKYLEAYQNNNNLVQSFFALFKSRPEPEWEDCFGSPYDCLYEISFLDALQWFIATYGEGAIVVLTLLLTYKDIWLWRKPEYHSIRDSYPSPYWLLPISVWYDWKHGRISALSLPTLKKHSPLDILVTFREIEKILPHFDFFDENRKYMWYIEQFGNNEKLHVGLYDSYYQSSLFKTIEAFLQGISSSGFNKDKEYIFYELQTLNRKLELFPARLSSWWVKSDPLVKLYLQNRAWDITKYGKPVADLTFPQPSILGATLVQVSNMVDFMAEIFKETLQQHEIEAVEKRKKEHTKNVENEFAKYMKNKIVPLPKLPLKALTHDSRETVKEACLNELIKNEQEGSSGKAFLVVIKELVHFCELLRQPENLIKKPTGQYIEKEVPSRTEADMVGEMRRELVGLPNFTAYAKIMQEKYKITTFTLRAKWPEDVSAKIQQEIIDRTYQDYCQKREIIEMQIRQKQAAWQKDLSTEPLIGRRN